jgi:hypothetical protein
MAYDLLFSYWLFLWFVGYYFHIISYNPKLMFILAMIYISIIIVLMIYKNLTGIKIFIFFILAIIFKLIPFYLIRNDSIKIRDIFFGFLLFFVYFLWVCYRKGKNKFIQIYTVDVFQFKTPIMNIFDVFYHIKN